jgi:hypothetical protein
MLWSWAKVFAAAVFFVILEFVTNGGTLTDVTLNDANTWLNAGLSALLPVVINYLNPKDARYGIGGE